MVHVGLGEVLCEVNELQSATQHLNAGIELAKQFANMDMLASGYVALARVGQAQGNDGAATPRCGRRST